MRLTKTYSDGTHGVADNLPCGENSYTYKDLLLESLGKYEDAEEHGLLVFLTQAEAEQKLKEMESDNDESISGL